MTRSLNAFSRTVINTQRDAQAQVCERTGTRGFHGSLRRRAILMPAMSPFLNEGTITRWKKKEGEVFAIGDVLLQIESDIAMIDVEAESPGILGKILLPDGTTNVPVEQVIALVARDPQELETMSSLDLPTPPPLNAVPSPPSESLNLASQKNAGKLRPSPIKTGRKPSLFELQAMGYAARTLTSARPPTSVTVSSPSMMENYAPDPRYTGPLSAGFKLGGSMNHEAAMEQLDGTTIRKKIMANLIGNAPKSRMTN